MDIRVNFNVTYNVIWILTKKWPYIRQKPNVSLTFTETLIKCRLHKDALKDTVQPPLTYKVSLTWKCNLCSSPLFFVFLWWGYRVREIIFTPSPPTSVLYASACNNGESGKTPGSRATGLFLKETSTRSLRIASRHCCLVMRLYDKTPAGGTES